MADQETIQTVSEIFSVYLQNNGHRKTPERLDVLREIYDQDGHFNVESLYVRMKNKNYQISRATIYNTIELLVDCNLIKRHQFGKNIAQFEKSYKYRQHDHLICVDCDKVFEFCDPRIQQIQTTTGESLKFNITHHSLNFYGQCAELANYNNCKHQNELEKNQQYKN